jgi:hypothetical protein
MIGVFFSEKDGLNRLYQPIQGSLDLAIFGHLNFDFCYIFYRDSYDIWHDMVGNFKKEYGPNRLYQPIEGSFQLAIFVHFNPHLFSIFDFDSFDIRHDMIRSFYENMVPIGCTSLFKGPWF